MQIADDAAELQGTVYDIGMAVPQYFGELPGAFQRHLGEFLVTDLERDQHLP